MIVKWIKYLFRKPIPPTLEILEKANNEQRKELRRLRKLLTMEEEFAPDPKYTEVLKKQALDKTIH